MPQHLVPSGGEAFDMAGVSPRGRGGGLWAQMCVGASGVRFDVSDRVSTPMFCPLFFALMEKNKMLVAFPDLWLLTGEKQSLARGHRRQPQFCRVAAIYKLVFTQQSRVDSPPCPAWNWLCAGCEERPGLSHRDRGWGAGSPGGERTRQQ